LDKLAYHMPHRSQIPHLVIRLFQKYSLLRGNGNSPFWSLILSKAFRLKDVSISNLNKIRKLKFPEYDAKKLGDNFAHCSTCDRLYLLRKTVILGFQAAMLWVQKLKLPLDSAWVHWQLYYANCYCL
jgi:hypothetical protein